MTTTGQSTDDPHPGETSLLSAISNGATTWHGRPERITFDPDAGPLPDEWGPSATIRAALVRQLLTGEHPTIKLPRRLQICRARIIGRLDLQDTTLKIPLEFDNCWFDQNDPVNLDYTTVPRITITN